MSDKVWPLERDSRPENREGLLIAESGDLAHWLTWSVRSWVEAGSTRQRARAFAPLVFLDDEPVDRQFAAWWQAASSRQRSNIQEAIAQAVETVDPEARADEARILLNIGGRLGSARAYGAALALLAKPVRRRTGSVDAFAEAVAYFARHATPQQQLMVAARLREIGRLAPVAAIQLLTRVAVGVGAEAIPHLDHMVPALFDEDDPSQHSERRQLRGYWANTMVDVAGAASAYLFGLEAHRRKLPQLREALEEHRLSLMGLVDGATDGERWLYDKVLRTRSTVNVADYQDLVERFAAEDELEAVFEDYSVDKALHWPPVETLARVAA